MRSSHLCAKALWYIKFYFCVRLACLWHLSSTALPWSLFPLSSPVFTRPFFPDPCTCCVLYPRHAPSPLVWIHRVYPLVAFPHLLTSPYLLRMSFWFRAKAFAPWSEGAPSGRGWVSHSAFWQPVGLLLSNDMPLFTPHLVWCLYFLISFLSLGNQAAPQYSYKRRPQVASDAFQVWNYCAFSLFSPSEAKCHPQNSPRGTGRVLTIQRRLHSGSKLLEP